MEKNTQGNNYENGYSNYNNDNQFASPERKESLVFKFVILGDSNVGKTSILYHYIFGKCMHIYLNIYQLKKFLSILSVLNFLQKP
jgi:hypothetical protein